MSEATGDGPAGPIREIALEELLARFGPQAQAAIRRMAAREGTERIALFENLDLSSSRCGEVQALAVGPGLTYRDVGELRGRHLGDLPSQRLYPVAYARAKTT
jgi:hypothetical protein